MTKALLSVSGVVITSYFVLQFGLYWARVYVVEDLVWPTF